MISLSILSGSILKIPFRAISNLNNDVERLVLTTNFWKTGISHLYFAFAAIDPKNFAIAPGNDGDAALYPEFTKLQSSSLETWIAIGGFDFSDPGP